MQRAVGDVGRDQIAWRYSRFLRLARDVVYDRP